MPATENDRLNLQQPTLANPSMPDHDRRKDEGMHMAMPEESVEMALLDIDDGVIEQDSNIAPPDQEFGQVLESGTKANGGRIHDDPNNWLTSDKTLGSNDMDPEDRGESLVDDLDGDKH